MSQTSPKIIIYLKTFCGWSEGVRSVMRKYKLSYEEKDVIKNPAFRWEMEQRSGQPLSPCVEVDGHMLADISGEEVEKWLIQNEYVQKNETLPDAPISTPCRNVSVKAGSASPKPAPARRPAKVSKIRFFD